MPRFIRVCRVLLISLGLTAAFGGKAIAATFQNTAPITFPAPGSSTGSQIAVSGLGNSVSSNNGVTVTITGLTNTHADDVDLVLVGPTGAALVLMGDAGGSTAISAPITLAYTDSGASLVPQTPLTFSGTFKPTQYASIGSFPSPGPGLAYSSPAVFGTSTFASIFTQTNPNGNWTLWAMDPASGDTGQISGGWSLQVTATPEPASLSVLALGSLALLHRRRTAA